MARGYYRTSRRTGVSAGIGPAILWLPFLFIGAIFAGIFAFFSADKISAGRKFVILIIFGAGVALCMIFHGSHCDAAGFCKQTKTQEHLTDVGVVFIIFAILSGIVAASKDRASTIR